MHAWAACEEMRGCRAVEQVSHMQAEFSIPLLPRHRRQSWQRWAAGMGTGQEAAKDSKTALITHSPPSLLLRELDNLTTRKERTWNWNFATWVENRCPTKEVPQFLYPLSLAKAGLASRPPSGFHACPPSCVPPPPRAKGVAWPSVAPARGNSLPQWLRSSEPHLLFLSKRMRGLYHNFHLKLNGVSELCIKPWYELQDHVQDFA